MIGFIIGLLTFILILDCLVLILLVIVQLPKKDAGAGMAFGGGAADALFGAGSGTVLTKITKYAAGIMFGLALVISVMQSHYRNQDNAEFRRAVSQAGSASAPVTQAAPPVNNPSPAAAPTAGVTNTLMSVPATVPVEK